MLIDHVKAVMQEYHMTEPGQNVAVALSGGRDSVCLLHLFKKLQPSFGYQLSAAHINHGLRKEAGEEEAFCRRLCDELQIPLAVFPVNVQARMKSSGESMEEAARNLRYQAFETLKADRIALGHHQQDQAETVLLHLLRGSGLTGLCGMRPVRTPYIRPLLQSSRAEIEAYIAEQKLCYVEDASNRDSAFRRNRIRWELLPLLQQEYNPEIVQSLAHMAQLLQQEEQYLEDQAPQPLVQDLAISWVLTYPINLQRRILRKWLAQNGLTENVSHMHIQQILQLMNGPSGKRISLPKGLTVDKSYDILHIHENVSCEQFHFTMPAFEMETLSFSEAKEKWKLEQEGRLQIPDLPEEKWLNADAFHRAPVWRYRKPGDYLITGSGRKKLKEYLIDEKIPRQERDALPLLADGDHVLWIFGHRISEGVKVTENTRQVLHVRRVSDVAE